MAKKDVDGMSVVELENEAGEVAKEKIRKTVVEERLYEKYKGIGKR